jgi:hypothetical protein
MGALSHDERPLLNADSKIVMSLRLPTWPELLPTENETNSDDPCYACRCQTVSIFYYMLGPFRLVHLLCKSAGETLFLK